MLWRFGLLSLLLSCSVITALTDLESAPVAGSAPVDGGPDDGASDASRPVLDDAGADAPAVLRCTPPTLCDDFEGDPLGARWSAGVGTALPASIGVTTDASFSGRRALTTRVPGGAGDTVEGVLRHDFVGPFRTFQCSFAMRILESDPEDGVVAFTLEATPVATSPIRYADVNLRVGRIDSLFRQPTFLRDGGGNNVNAHVSLGAFPLDEWFTFSFEVALDDGPAFRVWIKRAADPQPVLLQERTFVFPESTQLRLLFGLRGSGPTQPWRILYDDLACGKLR